MAGNIVPRADGDSNLGTAAKEFNIIYAKDFGGTIASKVVSTNSPTFTGTPSAPTAAAGTATTQIATTAFTDNAVSTHNSATTAHSDIRTAVSGKADGSCPISDWVSGATYALKDIRIHEGKIYQCTTANSDTEFDTDKWQNIGCSDDYLPLSGGAMSGRYITRDVDDGTLSLVGGSSEGKGAGINLKGKDHPTQGEFVLYANNGDATTELKGNIDGTLKWKGFEHWAFPTAEGQISYTLPANGGTITAPADGYLNVAIECTEAGGACYLEVVAAAISTSIYCENGKGWARTFIPVSKTGVVFFYHGGSAFTTKVLVFCPCKA